MTLKHMKRISRIGILLILAAAITVCASAAYKGHANDDDVNALLAAYPKLKGTSLDSCATCHRDGTVTFKDKPGVRQKVNSCDYCHVIYMKGGGDIKETLNAFGADYDKAGRNTAAFKSIAAKDSDRDGSSNADEIAAGFFPGDPGSKASMRIAGSRLLTKKDIEKFAPAITETAFMNTTENEAGDFYYSFTGHPVYKLLVAAGMADNATTVDFISLDGYVKTYTVDDLKKMWPQSKPVPGLGAKELGACGWVNYNAGNLDPSKPLPPAKIILVVKEAGKRIEKAYIDEKTGKIVNTGPYRLFVPQFKPSPPDLPEHIDKTCVGKTPKPYRFHEDYDHNGGKSNFAIVAIRINPLPKGTRDFEWGKMSENYIRNEQIIVFGALKPRK
jgi:hypothetical protein